MRRSARALAVGALLAVVSAAAPASAQTSQRDAILLEQNVPNPFTPGFSSTIIADRIDRDAPVRITVFNLLAQEVGRLVDQPQRRGRYVVTWDGLDADGDPVPAGRYWYRLQVGDAQPILRQMLILDASEAPAGSG